MYTSVLCIDLHHVHPHLGCQGELGVAAWEAQQELASGGKVVHSQSQLASIVLWVSGHLTKATHAGLHQVLH